MTMLKSARPSLTNVACLLMAATAIACGGADQVPDSEQGGNKHYTGGKGENGRDVWVKVDLATQNACARDYANLNFPGADQDPGTVDVNTNKLLVTAVSVEQLGDLPACDYDANECSSHSECFWNTSLSGYETCAPKLVPDIPVTFTFTVENHLPYGVVDEASPDLEFLTPVQGKPGFYEGLESGEVAVVRFAALNSEYARKVNDKPNFNLNSPSSGTQNVLQFTQADEAVGEVLGDNAGTLHQWAPIPGKVDGIPGTGRLTVTLTPTGLVPNWFQLFATLLFPESNKSNPKPLAVNGMPQVLDVFCENKTVQNRGRWPVHGAVSLHVYGNEIFAR